VLTSREDPERPRAAALLLLAVVALAAIATSQAAPAIEDGQTAEVTLDGGTTISRDIRVHLDPAGGESLASGRLSVGLRSAADFGDTGSDLITIALAPADGPTPTNPVYDMRQVEIPVDACRTGCDLTYRAWFSASPAAGSGATIRYSAAARFTYDNYGASPPQRWLEVAIEGGETPVSPLIWALVAALAGIGFGAVIGRRVRSQGTARLLAPLGLTGVLVSGAVIPLIEWGLDQFSLFTAALLLSHAAGIVAGMRRWSSDGGWLLGLAGVSTIALCGLWLAWVVGSFAVVHPLELAVTLAGLGLLTGIVVGQAWGARSVVLAGRQLWAVVAVVSQGLLVAGLVFVGIVALVPASPFDSLNVMGLVPLGVAALLGVGVRRWFDGSRGLMLAVNIVLFLIGLLGLVAWVSLRQGFAVPGVAGSIVDPADAVIVIEVIAAGIGIVAATRRFAYPTIARQDPVPGT